MKIAWQKIRSFFQHFFTLDDSPANIAGGAALGVFLGILPGEGLATTLILASLLRLNKAAATIGVLATNMWGTVVVFPVAAFVGGFLFHADAEILAQNFQSTYHLGLKYFLSKAIFFDFALPLIIGFVISAGLVALIFYFTIFYLLKYSKNGIADYEIKKQSD